LLGNNFLYALLDIFHLQSPFALLDDYGSVHDSAMMISSLREGSNFTTNRN